MRDVRWSFRRCSRRVHKKGIPMKTRILALPVALLCSPAFAEDVAPTAGPLRLEAAFELLPMGSARGTVLGTTVTTDTVVAYGISTTFDAAVGRYLRLGVAPRLIFNVKSSDSNANDTADKELDL